MVIKIAIENVRKYMQQFGIEDRIMEFGVSSATVELAAQALHCEPGRIAKTLSFMVEDQPILIVTAGVCPFGIKDGVTVYLDESLRKYDTVFPACGSSNSAIELTIEEMEKYTPYTEWVDVCKESV